jgi:hypothetical protein
VTGDAFTNVFAGIFLFTVLFAAGLVDLFLGLLLGVLILGINGVTGFAGWFTQKLSFSETYAGATGRFIEGAFVVYGCLLLGILIVILLLIRIKPGPGLTPGMVVGCGTASGLVLGIGIWVCTASEVETPLSLVMAWGIAGGLLGFLVSLIPGAPWD